MYLQLFHYTLSTVFTTPSNRHWMQIMTSYNINSKGEEKMEIDDSEVDEQHFCSLYIPSGSQSSNHIHQTLKGMLSESSMPIFVTYSDHLNCRLETQQNSLAPFDPHSAIIIWLIMMWRLGFDPALLCQ
jgi:hypothetical protein